MPQEPIEPAPPVEKNSEALSQPERLPEAAPAAPKQSPERAVEPSPLTPVELPAERMQEHASEPAAPDADVSSSSPPHAGLTTDELLQNPHRIRSLAPEAQVNIVLDLVVQKKFPAAHQFIEQLGKKEDLAFYAWLEDSLHDAATREDWRRFIEEQK